MKCTHGPDLARGPPVENPWCNVCVSVLGLLVKCFEDMRIYINYFATLLQKVILACFYFLCVFHVHLKKNGNLYTFGCTGHEIFQQ